MTSPTVTASQYTEARGIGAVTDEAAESAVSIIETYSLSDATLLAALAEHDAQLVAEGKPACGDHSDHIAKLRAGEVTLPMLCAVMIAYYEHSKKPNN